jgi:hypothetical protein
MNMFPPYQGGGWEVLIEFPKPLLHPPLGKGRRIGLRRGISRAVR